MDLKLSNIDRWRDKKRDLQGYEEEVAYQFAVRVTNLSFVAQDTGWLSITKGEKNGKRVVAFVGADSLTECLEWTAYFANMGQLDFREDKKPPWERK